MFSIQLVPNHTDYPNIEVIIIDDSPTPNSDVAVDYWIHYYHIRERLSIGKKRNMAVEKSKGSIIVHWDDDDYFREHRVTQQVS